MAAPTMLNIRLASAAIMPRSPAVRTLASPSTRADYVVIGPRAFVDAAEPLLAHRAEQGLVSKGVAVEDLQFYK